MQGSGAGQVWTASGACRARPSPFAAQRHDVRMDPRGVDRKAVACVVLGLLILLVPLSSHVGRTRCVSCVPLRRGGKEKRSFILPRAHEQ